MGFRVSLLTQQAAQQVQKFLDGEHHEWHFGIRRVVRRGHDHGRDGAEHHRRAERYPVVGAIARGERIAINTILDTRRRVQQLTTITLFTPTSQAPFTFQATLDSAAYTCAVLWNMWRQWWYLQITDQSGNLVCLRALVGSPPSRPIGSIAWNNGIVTLTTSAPHGYAIGGIVNLTVSGAAPAAYSGTYAMNVTGPSTLTYPLAAWPGAASALGNVVWNFEPHRRTVE